jgi:hypothetical protein
MTRMSRCEAGLFCRNVAWRLLFVMNEGGGAMAAFNEPDAVELSAVCVRACASHADRQCTGREDLP